MEIINLLDFTDRIELREWLKVNHNRVKSCWVVTSRSKQPTYECIPYIEVVEEALCFRWIDSTLKKLPDGCLTSSQRKSLDWVKQRTLYQSWRPRTYDRCRTPSLWESLFLRNSSQRLSYGRKTAFLDLAELRTERKIISTIESPHSGKVIDTYQIVERKQSSYRSLLLHRYNLLTSQQQRSPPNDPAKHPRNIQIYLSPIAYIAVPDNYSDHRSKTNLRVFFKTSIIESKTIAIRATKRFIA